MRDSLGVYTLPEAPFTPSTLARSARVNSNNTDIAAELTDSLSRSGKGGMLAPLAMGAKKITGLADGTAATDAASTGQVAAAVGAVGSSLRNVLLNPLFNVQQRGAGPFGAATVGPDRWEVSAGTGGGVRSVTIAGATDAVRAAVGDEDAAWLLSYQYSGGGAAGDADVVVQKLDGVRRLSGKTWTLSFWAAAASGTPKIAIEVSQFFGTGGSPSAGVFSIGMSVVTTSTTWTRYTATFAIPSAAGKTFGTAGNDYTAINLWLSGGATYAPRISGIGQASGQIYFWGMQLEQASAASALEKRPITLDLAQCQRYYQLVAVDHFGYGTAGALLGLTLPLPVVMRGTPTATPVGITYGNGNSLALSPNARSLFYYYAVTVTGQTQLGGFVALSAEP